MPRMVVFTLALTLVAGSAYAQVPARSEQGAAERRLVLSGQVGFRIEFMSNENFAEDDATRDDDARLRFRSRLRVAGRYDVSDQVTLGFRVSTGSTAYPSSGWSSLNDDFRRDQLALDRVYVILRPRNELQLQFGFNANPLFRPTELVWDGDVSPGGFAEILRLGDVEFVAGQFMLREVRTLRPGNQQNGFLFAHGISYVKDGPVEVRVGAFNYLYSDADVIAQALDEGSLDSDFQTNRFQPGAADFFFSEFNIFGASVSVSSGQVRFVAEGSINAGAKRDAALGVAYADRENFAAGGMLTVGRLQDAWDWQLSAGFFHIEADAVIAAYNSDDLQQTNVNTVPIVARLRLPGGAGLTWDSYIQSKIDNNLASNGGIIHDENATKLRTRLTIQASF